MHVEHTHWPTENHKAKAVFCGIFGGTPTEATALFIFLFYYFFCCCWLLSAFVVYVVNNTRDIVRKKFRVHYVQK